MEALLAVLHAGFGDSPNLNLEAEITAFRDQCRARAPLDSAVLHS